MSGDRERNVYRIVVLVIGLVGAVGLLWYLAQGGEGVSGGGIFELFSDPGAGTGSEPAGSPR